METVLILLAIVWVIVPVLAKKKQQQAKEEAERQRAARQQAPQATPQRAPQAVRTAPLTPTMRTPMKASYEGTDSSEGNFSGSLGGTSRQKAALNLKEVTSTLTQSMNSITHTVAVSSESGHAHEETSMSGLDSSCPPDQMPANQPTQSASGYSYTAFNWHVEQARNGLVMAEILGPCLANRD